jgi:hypothetical protein
MNEPNMSIGGYPCIAKPAAERLIKTSDIIVHTHAISQGHNDIDIPEKREFH